MASVRSCSCAPHCSRPREAEDHSVDQDIPLPSETQMFIAVFTTPVINLHPESHKPSPPLFAHTYYISRHSTQLQVTILTIPGKLNKTQTPTTQFSRHHPPSYVQTHVLFFGILFSGGYAVDQLVQTLRHTSESCGFHSRWGL